MQPMVNIALRAARQAGEMIVKAADNLELVRVDEKGRHDFVTEVDRRSEEIIDSLVRKVALVAIPTVMSSGLLIH